jgi:hypothetical protein
MKQNSANPYQKKLLIALLILKPINYFLRLKSCKLTFEKLLRALVALEILMADKQTIPTIQGKLYFKKPTLCNWIMIRFFTKPDRSWSNKQGGSDQNQTDPVSIRITSKISGKISLNI